MRLTGGENNSKHPTAKADNFDNFGCAFHKAFSGVLNGIKVVKKNFFKILSTKMISVGKFFIELLNNIRLSFWNAV